MRIEYELEVAKMEHLLKDSSREQLYVLCIQFYRMNYQYREVASAIMRQELPPITPP